MQIKTLMVLTREEAIEQFNPPFIAETFMRGSKPTQTMKGKRIFKEMFSGKEDEVNNLVQVARRYYHNGVPLQMELTTEKYALWTKLCHYCSLVA